MAEETRTALGSAHDRFMRSLADRGRELQELVRALEAPVRDERAEEQLRRRLHALYASAQVFQETPLLSSLKGVLGVLEAAQAGRRAPARTELASVLALCRELGAGEPQARRDDERASTLFRKDRWSAPPPPNEQPSGGTASALRGDASSSVAIERTVAGSLDAAPDVIAVLIVAHPAVESALRDALPVERCELTSTSDPETARLAIDQVAPDVVLIETSLLSGSNIDLAQQLRGARAGSVRAVIAVVPELIPGDTRDRAALDAVIAQSGVDASVRLPFALPGLHEQLLRLTGRDPAGGQRAAFGLEGMQSGTVDEIARGVAEEIRRGIADSLRLGRGERIELRERSELMAAAWSAVARIRTHLAETAAGRVRFEQSPYPGSPAALALTDDLPAAPYVGVGDTLEGRRIVLADDDPAVLWFFAGLLSEAGAIVIEASNGKEALESLRRRVPDLVISDILMPEIDGFTLCRELRRDLALCHVPVILLSWKEDFLQRMRELEAGAAGYLRKEAGSLQILVTVADALRPRAELCALLELAGEVQGRTDALGVPGLLYAVAAQRPDARVTVRDAWNIFEIDVRGGSRVAVTRTAADGSFVRGAAALRQLIGVDVGRFAVEQATSPVRGLFEEPLDKLLADGVRQLGAVLDAVSDSRLMRIARVGFDDEILSALLSATPTALADAAARLRAGESPAMLVMQGAYAPRELEQHLRELARRGAILFVTGEGNEDLVELALRTRDEQPGALMHTAERPTRESQVPMAVGDSEIEWVTPRPRPSGRPLAPASRPPPPLRRSQMPAGVAAKADPPPMPLEAPAPSAQDRASSEPAELDAGPSARLPTESVEPSAAPEPVAAAAAAAALAPAAAQTLTDVVPRSDPPAALASARPSQAPRPSAGATAPALRGGASSDDGSGAFSVRSKLLPEAASAGASRESSTPRLRIEREVEPSAGARGAGLAIMLAACLVLGFFGWRVLQTRGAHDAKARTSAPPSSRAASPPPVSNTAATGGAAALRGGAAQPAPVATGAVGSVSGLGRTLPFIDHSRNVEVTADQGLLVVDYDGSAPAPRVSVGGRDLGSAPLAAPLPAGRHELMLKREDGTRVRYFALRAGETQIVEIHE